MGDEDDIHPGVHWPWQQHSSALAPSAAHKATLTLAPSMTTVVTMARSSSVCSPSPSPSPSSSSSSSSSTCSVVVATSIIVPSTSAGPDAVVIPASWAQRLNSIMGVEVLQVCVVWVLLACFVYAWRLGIWLGARESRRRRRRELEWEAREARERCARYYDDDDDDGGDLSGEDNEGRSGNCSELSGEESSDDAGGSGLGSDEGYCDESEDQGQSHAEDNEYFAGDELDSDDGESLARTL